MNPFNIKTITKISLSVLLLLCCVSEIRALTMSTYSIQDLWQQADIVCLGQVKTINYKKYNGRVITTYQLKIEQTFKSILSQKKKNKISLVLPGGRYGQYQQYIPGIPQLQTGTPYLSFLRCQSNGQCMPIGYGQGIWTLQSTDSQIWAPLIKDIHLTNDSSPLQPQSLESLLSARKGAIDESPHHSLPNVIQP